jgi:nicotinate-nucleotide adenylyltransferase
LLLAEAARDAHRLDEVWLLPNQIPPHRQGESGLASARDRYAMVCLASAGNPHLKPSSLEIERDEVSYTINTVERLAQEHPHDRFTFITGADSLAKDAWFRLDDLLGLLETFVVATRGSHSPAELEARVAGYGLSRAERIRPMPLPTVDISSTEIRRRVREGQGIRYMVADAVEDYIRKMGLYR